jgi:hypothetical protein
LIFGRNGSKIPELKSSGSVFTQLSEEVKETMQLMDVGSLGVKLEAVSGVLAYLSFLPKGLNEISSFTQPMLEESLS